MDVHGARDRRVGQLGGHDVEDRVHHLVTPNPENGRSEDLVGFGVDHDLHEALGLTLLHGPTDPGHRTDAHQRFSARAADLVGGHPGPAQGWIDVQRVGGDPVADPAWIIVEQVGRHDLEIVVGGVREGALAVAVPHRPDVLDVGTQGVVDLDVATAVGAHAGVLQAEVVGIGHPAHRDQGVTTGDRCRTGVRGDFETVVPLGEPDIVGPDVDLDPFAFQDLPDGRRDILVLAGGQSRPTLDHRHLGTESPVHLRELQRDITSADDDEMFWQRVEFE